MKKKSSTAALAGSLPNASKIRKHGPEKEKVQITLRVQKELMDLAYQQTQRTNTRMTDYFERGLVLALKEEDQDLSQLALNVRFAVANTTRVEQEQLRDFLTYLRADEVRPPSETDIAIRRFITAYLKTFLSLRNQVQGSYARYGRTEAEIEKMTG